MQEGISRLQDLLNDIKHVVPDSSALRFIPTLFRAHEISGQVSAEELKSKRSQKILLSLMVSSLVIWDWALEGKKYCDSALGKTQHYMFKENSRRDHFQSMLLHMQSFLEVWADYAATGDYASSEEIFRQIEVFNEDAVEGLHIFRKMISGRAGEENILGYTRHQALFNILADEGLDWEPRVERLMANAQHYLLTNGRSYGASYSLGKIFQDHPQWGGLAKAMMGESRRYVDYDLFLRMPEPHMVIPELLLAPALKNISELAAPLLVSLGVHGLAAAGFSSYFSSPEQEFPQESLLIQANDEALQEELKNREPKAQILVDQLKEKAGLLRHGLENISATLTYKTKLPRPVDPTKLASVAKPAELPNKFQKIVQSAPQMKLTPLPSQVRLISKAQHYLKDLVAAEAVPAFDYQDFFMSSELIDASAAEKGLRASMMQKLETFYAKLKEPLEKETYIEQLSGIRMLMHETFIKDYVRKNARLIDCIAGAGCNCEGETKIWVSILNKIQLNMPPGILVGVQVFDDHIQPVLYEKGTGQVQELVSGELFDKVRAPIYAPAILLKAYLKGQGVQPDVKADLLEAKLLIAKRNMPLPSNAGKKYETNSKLKIEEGEGSYNSGKDVPLSTIIPFGPLSATVKKLEVPVVEAKPAAAASASAAPKTAEKPEAAKAGTGPAGGGGPAAGVAEKNAGGDAPEVKPQLKPPLRAMTMSVDELEDGDPNKQRFHEDGLPFGYFDESHYASHESGKRMVLLFNSSHLVFDRAEDQNAYLALEGPSDRKNYLRSLVAQSLTALLMHSPAGHLKEILRNPGSMQDSDFTPRSGEALLHALRQHVDLLYMLQYSSVAYKETESGGSGGAEYYLVPSKSNMASVTERDKFLQAKIVEFAEGLPVVADLLFNIEDFEKRFARQNLEFLLFLDSRPVKQRQGFFELKSDAQKMRALFDDPLKIVRKSHRPALDKTLSDLKTIGAFGNTRIEPDPEDLIPVEFEGTERLEVPDNGVGKSERILTVPKSEMRISDKKRQSLVEVTPLHLIHSDFMLQLLFEAHGGGHVGSLAQWTPELSEAFLQLNRDGGYDERFMMILDDLVWSRHNKGLVFRKIESVFVPVLLREFENEFVRKIQPVQGNYKLPQDLQRIVKDIEKRAQAASKWKP